MILGVTFIVNTNVSWHQEMVTEVSLAELLLSVEFDPHRIPHTKFNIK